MDETKYTEQEQSTDEQEQSTHEYDEQEQSTHEYDEQEQSAHEYDEQKQSTNECDELDQLTEWIEANKLAHELIREMITNEQKGIIVVATNIDQLEKPNDGQFEQDIPFTMMINSSEYMKDKIEILPYTVYSFHSETIVFDNVTIDGCVYVIDCVLNGIGECHVTHFLVQTAQSAINYEFNPYVNYLPIDVDHITTTGRELFNQSLFDTAIQFFRFVVFLRVGILHLDAADALHWLGVAYNGKGESSKEIECYCRALKIKLAVLGEDDINIATLYKHLGDAYYRRDEYDKAIESYEKELKLKLNELGENHIDIANLYNTFGDIYVSKEEHNNAIEYYEKGLRIKLGQLGEDHIDVATLYHNLGTSYAKECKFDKAIEYFKKELLIKLNLLGEDHIDVAALYHNLGRYYFLKDEYNEAIKYFEKELKIKLNALGDGNVDIAELYFALGCSYCHNDQHKLGLEYCEKSFEINSHHSNEEYIEFAKLYDKSGEAYMNKEQYNNAIECFEKGLIITIEKLGENHINVVELCFKLGIAYYCGDEYSKAIECIRKSLKIAPSQISEIDFNAEFNTASAYAILGFAHTKKGEYNRGIEYLEKALKMITEKPGKNHFTAINLYNRLICIYELKGEYDIAFEYEEKIMKIWSGGLDEDTFKSFGRIYFEKGEYEKSIECHEEALKIGLKRLKENDVDIARLYNELGLVWIKGKGQINKAKEYVDKALEILYDRNGEFQLDIAVSHDILGLISEKKRNNDKAIEYFEQSLAIRSKKLNEDNPSIAMSFYYLASVYKNKNELDKSIEFGQKALDLRIEKLDPNHPHIGESYVLLGDVYFIKGDIIKAKKYYEDTMMIFTEKFGEQNKKTQDVRLKLEKIDQNNEEKKEEKEQEFEAYIIVNQEKKLIKMKELTFEELLRQAYFCLPSKDFQKINNRNLRLQIMDMKDNIIESDATVKGEFEKNKPSFKIMWVSFQPLLTTGKTKTIANALVVMIAISEYNDDTKLKNLRNVKEKDISNFKQLFKQELNYEFVCNESSKMTKQDVQEFMDQLIINFKLRRNANNFDGLIMIICGHGDDGNVFITSDGKLVSIDKIRASFNCHEMESLKDFPKIFIIDACRGQNIPKSHEIVTRGNENTNKNISIYGHNDDEFLTIWSTTKGFKVCDLSLLSKSMKDVIISKYKFGYPFKQMLQDVRDEIRKSKSGEWYCVESQDTTSYDIIFTAKNS
ncbi:hypothetical protein RFI_29501 [Reticulomyxa filosa]|uniref:Caspase family p20 domain-containing protein n=1 Tax=Reticulomyxa filosa TaxID=46433 RepID=X6M189_RETFI|nr:hypothetical protein RFI_29501 [Reticulomyxa filosa]|eukprot:ETO07888.1 hypothetical protein RFI_29501 [Reticulomyxa filosa]